MESVICWGIFREIDHSPNRESDDEAILRAVGEKLQKNGISLKLFSPSELEQHNVSLPTLIFYMCEKESLLKLFTQWQKQGVIFVNPPQGVKNTFREQTLRLLSRCDFFPSSSFVSTVEDFSKCSFSSTWIKRGDYHAVCPEDVVFAKDNKALIDIMKKFAQRGIRSVLLQDHVEGDLIKFYGVKAANSPSRWFHWFYHKQQKLNKYPFALEHLRGLCERGADLLELEVYGGDAIITPHGKIFIIDFNAWPSFALFRDEASTHIAEHIAAKIAVSIQQQKKIERK